MLPCLIAWAIGLPARRSKTAEWAGALPDRMGHRAACTSLKNCGMDSLGDNERGAAQIPFLLNVVAILVGGDNGVLLSTKQCKECTGEQRNANGAYRVSDGQWRVEGVLGEGVLGAQAMHCLDQGEILSSGGTSAQIGLRYETLDRQLSYLTSGAGHRKKTLDKLQRVLKSHVVPFGVHFWARSIEHNDKAYGILLTAWRRDWIAHSTQYAVKLLQSGPLRCADLIRVCIQDDKMAGLVMLSLVTVPVPPVPLITRDKGVGPPNGHVQIVSLQ
ncbi:hypothetical protein GOP47_0019847 [Adiantum capillus-veneris]|uniref:Uncharacterized protein n=1 Tax=Adiantum capillus-veneris TaxID=13818 RepID=A0A9D4Z903_ADICA|nr:hypothetical protein GOP47_0019847 [Adiantum capillus-veneris]